jgi:hypothetical protein
MPEIFHSADMDRFTGCTRWFKYDRDYLCVNKSQFVPVIFEPPYIKSMNFKPICNVVI